MSTDLTIKQQRFADLVLSGMPASRAYREAGYKASTDATAEVEGSRLLRVSKVATYLAERRAKAADRAELNYAGFLREVADFARDKNVDDAQRFAAYRFVTEQLARITPLATPVPEATGEGTVERAARINIGILETIMAGRMPVEQGMRCLEVVDKASQTIVSANWRSSRQGSSSVHRHCWRTPNQAHRSPMARCRSATLPGRSGSFTQAKPGQGRSLQATPPIAIHAQDKSPEPVEATLWSDQQYRSRADRLIPQYECAAVAPCPC